MYNSQIVVARIKRIAKEKSISMAFINEKCELSESTISSSAKSTYGMKAKNLYMIADCLNVSVDYLLGRTDEPQANKGHLIQTGSIGNYSSHGNTSVRIADSNKQLDETSKELLKAFNELGLGDKAKVMSLIAELSTK